MTSEKRNMALLNVVLLVVLCEMSLAVDKCAWGESYWCSDVRVAKQCGAFNHCKQAVWSKNKPQIKNSTDVCDFCRSVVTDVRNFITQQQTEEQIQQFLDSACAIIPDQDLSAKCKDLIDNYIDEVFQLIKSELDPDQVCSALGLCSGFLDTAVHPTEQRPRQFPVYKIASTASALTCDECKLFVEELRNVISSNSTEASVEKFLDDQLCSKFGIASDECKDLVHQYIPEIFDLLKSQVEPDVICKYLGFCKGSLEDHLGLVKLRLAKSPFVSKAKTLSTTECELCKIIITEIQTLDRNVWLQHGIEDLIKAKICAKLGALKNACEMTVNDYATDLFEILASALDPEIKCASLSLCTGPAKVKVANSEECILCEFIIKEVDSLLESNATQQEIIDALDKVCSLLPDTISQQCNDFISHYGPAIMDLLSQEMDPAVVCQTLGLCTSKKSSHVNLKLKLGNDELCGVCETLIQYLDSLLSENATVQEIEAALDKVCNFIPNTLQKQCFDLIAQYGAQIVQMIAKFADPKEICTVVHLCPDAPLTATKASLLGQNECTWGPSYWCAHMDNAVKCKAVAHCKKHVWA